MKTKLFAAAMAALTLATAGAAAAQDFRRGDGDRGWDRGDWRGRQEITVRKDGRTFSFVRGDRMFYRLLDRPFNFRPGLTYAYTDRCNRAGCIAFVFDSRHRRPIDRIFAPRLPDRRMAWRDNARFDNSYGRFGHYDRDDRAWNNDLDERNYRAGRADDDLSDNDRGPNDAYNRGDRGGDWNRGDSSGLDGGPRTGGQRHN
jgi:hypothetical protein